MAAHYGKAPGKRRGGRYLAARHCCGYLPKQPGVAHGAAPHGHAVAASGRKQSQRSLRAGHIAVGPHGNAHRGLHPRYLVCMDAGLIHFLPCAAVHRQHGNARVLAALCHLGPGEGGSVPADAQLYRHRHLARHGLHHRARHLPGQRRRFQQRRAGARPGYLRSRAAHVDVDKIEMCGIGPARTQCQQKPCGLSHHSGLVPEKLHAVRHAATAAQNQLRAFFIAHRQGLSANHLAHGAHRAVLSRNAPHRLICDAGHGRKRGTAPQRHHLQMFVLL